VIRELNSRIRSPQVRKSMTRVAVELKVLIEQMREQVQNLE
jgi:uncharacterized protein YicC (UPF0701 family)